MKTIRYIYFLILVALVLFTGSAFAAVEKIFVSENLMDSTIVSIDTNIVNETDTTIDTNYSAPYPIIKTTFYLDNLDDFSDTIFGIQFVIEWDTMYFQFDSIFINISYWGGMVAYNKVMKDTTAQCLVAWALQYPVAKDSLLHEVFTAYFTRPMYDPTGETHLLVKDVYLNDTPIDNPNYVPVDVSEEPGLIPELFVLSQNYPNPFNPTTTIDFSLARAGQVTLRIFNVLGQEIKTVDFGFMHVGEHSFIWDGTDNNNREVTSGVYFYRLEGEQVTEAKKMILLK